MASYFISALYVYPVKSLGGIAMPSVHVLQKGIAYDRRWMLMDNTNTAMTQRVFPLMALFKLSAALDGFLIRFENENIHLPLLPRGDALRAQVWNDEVDVIEVSRQHSEWFSRHLGVDCRLVYFPEPATRPIEAAYASHHEQVSLADAYPLLVIGQASLDDLNDRMNISLPMNRFRPNIVFTGGRPYEEDEWQYFHVGDTLFRGTRPCSRCVLTTVDQDTGNKGTEPLVTLATFRKKGNHIYFGQNVMVIREGVIKIGDEIALEKDNYF